MEQWKDILRDHGDRYPRAKGRIVLSGENCCVKINKPDSH